MGGDLDASMSNVKLWQSLGYAAQFVAGIFLTFERQLQILWGLQVLGALCILYLHCKVESIDDPYALTYESVYSAVYEDYAPNWDKAPWEENESSSDPIEDTY